LSLEVHNSSYKGKGMQRKGSSCVCMVKGPSADATDALQPWGLLCNPMLTICFFVVPFNGALVEWNWQGKTEVLGGGGGEPCPSGTSSTTNPTWTNLGSNLGLHGERPATNRLSHGQLKVAVTHLGGRITPWPDLNDSEDWLILVCIAATT
jgi:hypothetical protein